MPGDLKPAASDWFGQPRGLTILFLTEMWAQFSFFGMRALLVYYMIKQLLLPQQQASLIYGTYAAFAYLTPIFGGLISDRWLTRRLSVVLGGAIMAAGHLMMMFEGLFYPALVTIAVGNGLFLPALPSQIGALYAANDSRRGAAYNIYYAGINLGAFLAPLVCGTVGEVFGWHYGFGLAGIGMTIGLLTYIKGASYLPSDPPRTKASRVQQASLETNVPRPSLRANFLLLGGIAGVMVTFRAAYEQVGNTVALWADQGVDLAFGDWGFIPMTWFQSLNPLLVLALTPLLVSWWIRLAAKGKEPSSITKMSIGAGVVGSAYLLLALAAALSGKGLANWTVLAGFFVVMTVGELLILPVGLGLFGRLAPNGLSATSIATWFLAAFFGNLFAGALGTFWTDFNHAAFFALTAGISMSSAVLLLLFDRCVRRAEAAPPGSVPAPGLPAP